MIFTLTSLSVNSVLSILNIEKLAKKHIQRTLPKRKRETAPSEEIFSINLKSNVPSCVMWLDGKVSAALAKDRGSKLDRMKKKFKIVG